MAWPRKVLNALNSYWLKWELRALMRSAHRSCVWDGSKSFSLCSGRGEQCSTAREGSRFSCKGFWSLVSLSIIVMASSQEEGRFLHRQTPLFCQLLPSSYFLLIPVTVLWLLPSPIWRGISRTHPSYPACLPFTPKLSGQAVCHHYLEFLQLFWISSSWLSFLCSARTALITKTCLLAKSQSQSFFSSSLTL